MDFLIYCKMENQTIRSGLVEAIKGLSESVFDHELLIMVGNSKPIDRIPEDFLLLLQEYLHNKTLSRDDEVFVYFPQNQQIGVWLLKRKGRIRIRRWQRPFPF